MYRYCNIAIVFLYYCKTPLDGHPGFQLYHGGLSLTESRQDKLFAGVIFKNEIVIMVHEHSGDTFPLMLLLQGHYWPNIAMIQWFNDSILAIRLQMEFLKLRNRH